MQTIPTVCRKQTRWSKWVTDNSGEFRIPADATLVAGETYVLHESATVKGYYYSKDVGIRCKYGW